MTIYSFNRMVKRVLGVSPSKIIQERIILEAKRLLVLSDMSVKEIASELNFQDEFYFSRYFKKSVGLSPKYFRTTIQ
ncbi:helix-turn-helix domain-containing protein [Chryseobacterium sp. 7]|uniref:helix-turn-helix domain-containing protein n=1 Tax=Chryseobacterium sp. 7 TaxID=2035214 RepID=UPI001E53F980|nr:helix-turn-helix domain-containing protein [Chryseobacterium sp. 7]